MLRDYFIKVEKRLELIIYSQFLAHRFTLEISCDQMSMSRWNEKYSYLGI